MNCLICKVGKPVEGEASVQLLRGEFHLLVSGVPALVCPDCGEAFLDEVTAEAVLTIGQRLEEQGWREPYEMMFSEAVQV